MHFTHHSKPCSIAQRIVFSGRPYCWGYDEQANAGKWSRPFTNCFKRFQGNPVPMASYSPPATNAHWRTRTHTRTHILACGLAVFIYICISYMPFVCTRWRFCTIGEWLDKVNGSTCVCVCSRRSHIQFVDNVTKVKRQNDTMYCSDCGTSRVRLAYPFELCESPRESVQ